MFIRVRRSAVYNVPEIRKAELREDYGYEVKAFMADTLLIVNPENGEMATIFPSNCQEVEKEGPLKGVN